jgi:hypothetical protein
MIWGTKALLIRPRCIGANAPNPISIYIYIYPDGQTHIQIDHILIDRRWYSDIFYVRSFRGADSETDYYLVGAKVRDG